MDNNVHKMANGQYAVCWQTVNAFEVWAFQTMAWIQIANDTKEAKPC